MSVFTFWRRNVQRDIDDELRFHFDERIHELIAQGIAPDEVRAQAVAEFGDVNDVRSDLRSIDSRLASRESRLEVLDGIRQDVLYSVRSLIGTPAISLTIVLTLALGLGVNAAMFSLLDVIFLRPPATVVDPGGVRRVWERLVFRNGAQFWSGFDYAGYAAIQAALAGQATVAVYGQPNRMTLGSGENAPRVKVDVGSANLFTLLGVHPALGRFFGEDENRLDAGAPVAVLSDALWKRQFAGDPDVVGRDITLSGHLFTVIGIAEPHFSGVDLDAADLWIPIASDPSYANYGGSDKTPWYGNPNINGFQILVRPLPDVAEGGLEQRATLALRQPGIRWQRDTTAVARFGSIIAARGPGQLGDDVLVAERVGGVAIIVLLIAFANVVNLLLARAVRRGREIAVRLALGISTARLVRLLVTESVLLSLVAATAALLAAQWGGAVLRKLLMPEVTWAENPLHWRVLLFGVSAAIAAGIVAGLVPALQSRSPDLTKALKAGAREGGGHRSGLREFLVASQAALSVVLLVGAALFVRSLNNVEHHDIGYAVDRLAFVSLAPPKDRAASLSISARLRQLEPRLAGIPGVERVAYTSMRPKWGIQFTTYFNESDTTGHSAFFSAVSPGFFAATGTRILRGRGFASDASSRTENVVLVNTTLADTLWPNEDPLGKCVRLEKRNATCLTVIGVTQNPIETGIKDRPEPHLWLSLDNPPIPSWGVGDVVLRAEPQRLAAVTAQARGILRNEFPGVVVRTATMAATMEADYRPWKLGATLFTLLGVLAALVAAIGIYSTVSYAVSQRMREFGVRAALGASGTVLVRQVLGDGLRSVAIGVVAGVVLALAAGKLVASLLYGVSPRDLSAMTLATVSLLVVATAASLAPARRAAKSDPIDVLRTE